MSDSKTTFINGTMYDHGTVEVTIAGKKYGLVKAINYKDKVEIGKGRGTSGMVRGTTKGVYDADGSIEFYPGKPGDGGSTDLMTDLGNGWMTRYVESIVITYGNDDQPLRKDELLQVRLLGKDRSSKEGNEPHEAKIEMFISKIIDNGVDPWDA